MRLAPKRGGICGVCGCMDDGLGVLRGGALIWVCSDPECLQIAKRFSMRQDEFNNLEAEAAIQGCGNAMGRFLDEAGFGHLFENMPAEIWAEAQRVGVAGYRRELKRLIDAGTIPF